MSVNRYMTPLKYKDGNGKERMTKLYFELDPIEFVDWTFENPLQAAAFQRAMQDLDDVEKEDSRDLDQGEIRTLLGVIKLLSQIANGTPDDGGDYFIKDPNWTSSYAYSAFRMLLLTNPKETETFMKTLLDNDTMDKFNAALAEAQDSAEKAEPERKSDSGESTEAKMEARIRAKIEAEKKLASPPAAPSE